MFTRIEVAYRPEFEDPVAGAILRRIELAHPAIRAKISWARLLEVFWLDVPVPREELIPAITEIFWDPVLQWLFTGNMIPSAAGKGGGIADLIESAPNRPGLFWAVERRFRHGVTDNVGRTTLEALEITVSKKLSDGRATSGSMLLLEGSDLNDEALASIARDVLCNELVETWSVITEAELMKNERFHPERIKLELPRVGHRTSDQVETISIGALTEKELVDLSSNKLWALSGSEMLAIRDYFANSRVIASRKGFGLSDPTDVELEVIAQTWSEHCKHKIFNAKITYVEERSGKPNDPGPEAGMPPKVPTIPGTIDSLFKTTIAATTTEIHKPWLLSVFDDNAGVVAFDDESAFCIKVETHNSPSALDPYGGALTGIVGVNRDILGCGLGAKPIFNTNVFCVAPPDYAKRLPEKLLHPRRILDGVRRGIEHGGNKSGIPTVNGALVFDERYLGKPLIYCGTGGFMPREIIGPQGGRKCETKEIRPGDRICMVGGRIGKDGIHGATFSSLALDETSPAAAVQLGDPITQKRMADFLLEARDLGLYRAITDNGAGGLSSSVGELARLSGGARMDVSLAKTKYPGLKPFELVVSESQERMTVAVPPATLSDFLELATRRGVEVSDIGEFNDTGLFDIFYASKPVGSLDLEFLHNGVPKLEIVARWKPLTEATACTRGASYSSGNFPGDFSLDFSGHFSDTVPKTLLSLLSRPNIASKEWLIRQYDHEVQGMSVVKPLHTPAPGTANGASGPNDAAVVKPKATSDSGIAVGCGINPKLSDVDPYLMAQAAVDEAIRNVLCVGAEFGKPECVVALVDNFCWPDPLSDPAKAASLVRACFGLRDAALALSAPLVSGKDSMKNDFRGKLDGKPVTISVVPTLLMTAVAKVPDVKFSKTADFKTAGDVIYLLGPGDFGLMGSELWSAMKESSTEASAIAGPAALAPLRQPTPNWPVAFGIYSWLGGSIGKEQAKLRSIHDVSDGGLLVSVSECLLSRGLGATISFPKDRTENAIWEFAFGEGFHNFVVSSSEADDDAIEAEWRSSGVPYLKLGKVNSTGKLEINMGQGNDPLTIPTMDLRSAWLKEGYWE